MRYIKLKAEIINNKKIKKILLKEDKLPFLIFIYLLIRGKKFRIDKIIAELQTVFKNSDKKIKDIFRTLEISVGLIKTSDKSLEIQDYDNFIANRYDRYIILQKNYFDSGENGKIKELLSQENGLEAIELWILTLFTTALHGDNGKIEKHILINKLNGLSMEVHYVV